MLVNSRAKEGKSSTANKKQNIKSTWFRAGTAGQFLQTVVLQVETAEATEIPKKTFWKCSQFVAWQMKFVQIFQAIEHSSRKFSQIHVFQIQGATPAT